MDTNAINFCLFTSLSSRASDVGNVEKMAANEDDRDTLFVNYASIAWHEMRRSWRGDRSGDSQRKTREPTRLRPASFKPESPSSTGPFDGPVPLSKMVEFLVEEWEEDSQD